MSWLWLSVWSYFAFRKCRRGPVPYSQLSATVYQVINAAGMAWLNSKENQRKYSHSAATDGGYHQPILSEKQQSTSIYQARGDQAIALLWGCCAWPMDSKQHLGQVRTAAAVLWVAVYDTAGGPIICYIYIIVDLAYKRFPSSGKRITTFSPPQTND